MDVNTVLETRTKELTRLRRSLVDMVKTLPKELLEQDENTIRTRISDAVNAILADLSEFITDDWTEDNEEELEEL